jgi:histidine triad (HIT) family protein
MSDCIFCKMLQGEIPSSTVYEDDLIAAFMDINQRDPYKVLIIPREHVEQIYDLNEEQSTTIFHTAVQIARVIRDVSGCDGLNVFQSNGAIAGQEVPHFHLHLRPRYASNPHDVESQPDRDVLDQLAADLRNKLQSTT